MKTFFEEPFLTLVQFEAKDVLTTSPNGGSGDPDEDEIDFRPAGQP